MEKYPYLKGEEERYRKLLQQYSTLIVSIVLKKMQKRDDVKDTVQNILLHLWKYREKLYAGDAKPIIIKACKQKVAEFYRLEEKLLFCSYVSDVQDTSVEDMELVLIKEEYLSRIEQAIAQLIPPIRQKIFKMNKVEGISQQTIASDLQMHRRTVEHHISQSLRFLKDKCRNPNKS